MDCTVFKTYRGWHEGIILKDRVYFDKSGNSILLVGLEDRLKRDESKYYYELNRINLFHKKKHANKLLGRINSDSENILSEIAQIINSKKIEMRIVISPLYDQIAMNQDDIDKLKQYFGKSNVYDYSGDSTITNDYHNYYERSHYRPFIGNKIMRRVYEQ